MTIKYHSKLPVLPNNICSNSIYSLKYLGTQNDLLITVCQRVEEFSWIDEIRRPFCFGLDEYHQCLPPVYEVTRGEPGRLLGILCLKL